MSEAAKVAELLAGARRDRQAVDPYPELGRDDAAQARDLGVQARVAAGETVLGARIGFTSRAKREAGGIDEPVAGTLTSGMLAPYGQAVDLDALIQPRVEPEIALLLGRDLEGPATVTRVLAATEAVFAVADVVDSRYRDYRYTAPDVVADNASAGLVLLGSRAVRPADLEDLRLVGCVVRVDGEVVATAAAAAALGHPAAAVAWLLDSGVALAAGSIVLTGGLTAAVPLRAGRAVTIEFDGLGTVDVYA